MKRRPRATRPPATGVRAPVRRKPANSYTPPEHDPLSDSRLRPLVERYASLAGARLDEVGPHVVEMHVPEADRVHFGDRDRILLAFAVGATEQSPDAEMAVVGSPFVDQLLAAIRARGARLSLGLVSGSPSVDDEETPSLAVRVRNATVGVPTAGMARHPVGRLLARVLIRAGASLEEHLVESEFFDLATGTPLPRDAAEICVAVEQARVAATKPARRAVKLAAARPVGDTVKLMVADLQARLARRVDQLRADSLRALAAELERIDAYYRELLEGVGAKESDGIAMADAGRAIQAEHARRRLEEERRHQVHVVVHPLQMVDMEMLVQRAEWTLTTSKGRRVTLAARRVLSGSEGWSIPCPTCAQTPSALVVCDDDQIACESCAHECSVCQKGFRASDGTVACHVDDAPACAEHARTCSSCGQVHCSIHDGECADGGNGGAHRTCVSCLAPCAHCGRAVCASHAATSAEDAPKGSRRLCSECVVYCEGRRSEPIGRDESVECATCERFVCEKHQATCDVDGKVHCSSHLVRTDQSRRLVCEADRSPCAHEPDTVFAADEVIACPVCARKACSAHVQECTSCGRRVCVGEWDAVTSHCATCRRLAPYLDPTPTELAAAADAAEGRAPDPKKWRAARDATHLVVEMSQGWKRRTVFTVREGERSTETVMSHSRGGSKRVR